MISILAILVPSIVSCISIYFVFLNNKENNKYKLKSSLFNRQLDSISLAYESLGELRNSIRDGKNVFRSYPGSVDDLTSIIIANFAKTNLYSNKFSEMINQSKECRQVLNKVAPYFDWQVDVKIEKLSELLIPETVTSENIKAIVENLLSDSDEINQSIKFLLNTLKSRVKIE